MNIKGIRVKNYRSFGGEGVYIDFSDKVNLFVGKNNSGKSNVLRFLNFLGRVQLPENKNTNTTFKSLIPVDDYFNLESNKNIEVTIYFEVSDSQKEKFQPFDVNNLYVTYQTTSNSDNSFFTIKETFIKDISDIQLREYESRMSTRGGSIEDCRERVQQDLKPWMYIFPPKIYFLDEFRKLISDKDLRERLHKIVHYKFNEQTNKTKKEALYSFIEEILGDKIEIQIPDLNEEIEIVVKGRHQRLTSMGTGIHEIILLGMYLISIVEDSIFCIDEPELHLHASVQRTFLKFLSEKTPHKYFISTHSNNFLDFEINNKSVFNTRFIDGKTQITKCTGIQHELEILNDLGIRASEIFQTNGIVWVEGPSDRIYIKKWLELFSDDLKEGLHFTFQYYGGKLLNQYTVSDSSYKELLNILFVNRHAYIVMDSDMTKKYNIDDLRDTKKRIIKECDSNGLKYWVTNGKEIENYLSKNILSDFCYSDVKRNKYHKIETYCPKFSCDKKLEFAKDITTNMTADELEDNEDLKQKIEELAQTIRSWNR